MARMLTEEEVEQIEKQRELRQRANAAMSWNERKRFEEAEERQMYDERYRASHGGLSKAEVQAAGPDGSGRQYAAIKRGFELQAAHERQKDIMGTRDVTRIEEARQKRLGMREQGWKAAEENRAAAIRAAELRKASEEKVAGINKQIAEINSQRDKDVETIRGKNNLEVAKEQGGTQVDVAEIGGKATVEAAQVQAEAQQRRLMAERLMQERKLDENKATAITKQVIEMVNKWKNKTTGKPTMTYEEALQKVMQQRKKMGLSVGTLQPTTNWED